MTLDLFSTAFGFLLGIIFLLAVANVLSMYRQHKAMKSLKAGVKELQKEFIEGMKDGIMLSELDKDLEKK